MADPVNRDRSIEHLLRQTLPASTAATPCLDAEQLAAWVARGLAQPEADAAERHLADCVDCQAMLAAFAESEPVAEASAVSVLPFRRRWPTKWLATAAAAAAAVLVWVAMPREVSDVPQVATTMARVEEQGAARPAAEAGGGGPGSSLQSRGAAAAIDPPTPVEPRLQAGSSLAQSASPSTAVNQERQSSFAVSTVPPSEVPRRFAVGAVQLPSMADSGAAGSALPAAPPSPPQTLPALNAAPPPPPPAAAPARAVAPPSPAPVRAAAPPPPSVPDGAEQGLSAESRRVASSTAAVRAEAAPISPSAMGTALRADLPVHARAGGQRAVEFSASAVGPATQEAAMSARPVRWRVEVTGVVARSADGGASWTAVPLAPSTFVTAGSAPVPGVCWLAGRDGIVLRSIDAATFVRVAFPETGAVEAIQARDASTATVTMVGGRVFTTADGGRSWRLVP